MKYKEIYNRTCDSTEIILMKDIKYRTIMDTLEARNNVWSNELISHGNPTSSSVDCVCSIYLEETEALTTSRQ